MTLALPRPTTNVNGCIPKNDWEAWFGIELMKDQRYETRGRHPSRHPRRGRRVHRHPQGPELQHGVTYL
jgi:hypothetical protein